MLNAADHLLTADELAERWKVPKSHVYRLTPEGLIPAVWPSGCQITKLPEPRGGTPA